MDDDDDDNDNDADNDDDNKTISHFEITFAAFASREILIDVHI